MSASTTIAEQKIVEDDTFIANMLEAASVPTLMMTLVHLTGDTTILEGAIKPRTPLIGEVQGYLGDAEKAEVRALALQALKRYRDGGHQLPPPPSAETVHRMMSFMVGEHVAAEYVPMMMEEMGLDGGDSRASRFERPVSESAREDFKVLIIGAGMSGLLAGVRLKELGVPFTIIEKGACVGGTWHENRYPGCRVDIASHFYSYSFEPSHDWTQFYSGRDELFAYFNRFADKHGIRGCIQFNTEVTSAAYDEDSAQWQVTLRRQGGEERRGANAVISAVGQLNRPRIPEIKGLELFKGAIMHSAEWKPERSLKGKRVAVIGTGASAFQLVPEVAKEASRLFVLQRSPVWMLPNPNYHALVSESKKWLLKHVPFYARWYRFLLFWPGTDGILPKLKMDPSWPHPRRAVNAHNDVMRETLTDYIKRQVGDDAALLEKVVPTYPVMVKRMLQDNGSWLKTLQRDNVELVTDGISEINASGVVCGGTQYDVDAIVFATGFHANKFLWPMTITGRGGVTLNDVWQDEPRAYLGITVPGFPNLFCMYGPGTNLAHGGSIIFNSECQVRYTVGCIKALLEQGKKALDCKPEVYHAYNTRLADELAGMVWSYEGVDSWYKNSAGRVVNTSPWRLVDYWTWTRNPDLADYSMS
ncbi:flavin-containing monooxygenase [Pseudoduganella namucuonensis]|uniref:4-hydroxyacetophenone monooxygenase n=1 Tax=Pseudoduganella namucuonensis TaxID=1035707 RepID=A0A1I7LSX3_9BURK|nr:NAD(P)/FAD-dependent oxidoreductase [Pseudoduganella namucuonensis]SFV12670.1 4-hydroxyacetophenone monooxygenase [Pseudoduganella namucuonensis]